MSPYSPDPLSSSDHHRRRWAVLVATIWIQAFTGTNFDFSAYSSSLKSALGASQVQLNYLAVASDLGKALGWSAGLAALRLPLWVVLVVAAAMGFVGYAMQWLLLAGTITLPYFAVFLLCLLAGVSICWFNTVCFVLCARNFPSHRPLALSLTVSFNGVSAALYTLIANAIASSSQYSLYLLLNATVPLAVSLVSLLPILRQPPVGPTISSTGADAAASPSHRSDAHVFSVLNVLAFVTGLYLLFLNSVSSNNHVAARVLLGGALVLLVIPLFVPGVVACSSAKGTNIIPQHQIYPDEDPELRKGLLPRNHRDADDYYDADDQHPDDASAAVGSNQHQPWRWCCWYWSSSDDHNKQANRKCHDPLFKDYSSDRLTVLGEEHTPKRMVRRMDFWLYYATYFCGATVGLVYSNNLGQIAQSLGRESETAMLVSVYSACSFFGRLLSSAPDLFRRKLYLARTGWLAIALVPMPLAFFLLAAAGDGHALLAGTALVGLSSGFIFAAAVSVTSELFGPNSIGLNHNILITNIPLGSLLYGLLAAIIYDANGSASFLQALLGDGATVCMGRHCYAATFIVWGCITLVGLVSGLVLFVRTRPAYDRYERSRAAALALQ